jgi:hypothetical protein
MKKLLLILLCSGCTYFAMSQNLLSVIVLSTGGIIAGQQPNTDKEGYLPGKISIEVTNIHYGLKTAISKPSNRASIQHKQPRQAYLY